MEPLVSCLCITKNRVGMLKRAVRLFQAQTYPHKELLIVYEETDRSTSEFLAGTADRRIKKLSVGEMPGLNLGRLRNLAVERCAGEYFCQWDDDDWYHMKRIEYQMRIIRESGMSASVLMHWLIFDATRDQAYLSYRKPWEGSLLCKTSLVHGDTRYDDLSKGEDTPIVKKLFAGHVIFPVMIPKLYIYNYHGGNVWEYDHWRKIFEASVKLSEASSALIKNILSDQYSVEYASTLLDGLED